MAYTPDSSIPDFKGLLTLLNNSKIATQNNPLYQTIKELIDRVSKLKFELAALIEGNTINIENLTETILVIDKGAVRGPTPAESTDNAIARWDGVSGRLIQNSTPTVEDDGRISNVTDPIDPQDVVTLSYLNTSGGISYVPMSTGAEPLEIMSNGAGEVLLIGYNP
jgi:hypothetical protein